jgi:hypothetical protein
MTSNVNYDKKNSNAFKIFFKFSGEISNDHSNRSNLFVIIITLLTFILVMMICFIIAIIVMNRKKLRKNQIRSQTNVNELESEREYDDTGIEDDLNYYLRMNYNLNNVYEEINYDQLNVEKDETVEYTEIFE